MNIGDTVWRRESGRDQEQRRATVLEIADGVVLLAYGEGPGLGHDGTGWWPVEAITPTEADPGA